MDKEKMYVITEFNSNLQEARAIFVTKDKQLAEKKLDDIIAPSEVLENYNLQWYLTEIELDDDSLVNKTIVDILDVMDVLYPDN